MGIIFVFGLLVCLDNFQIASALGMLDIPKAQKWRIALAFGLFEGLMPLLGLLTGQIIAETIGGISDTIGPIVLLICGVVIILLSFKEQDLGKIGQSTWLLFGLPLILSFDNLLAGIGLGASGFPIWSTALIIGTMSASVCFLGMYLGGFLRKFLPGKAEIVSGAYLILLAVFLLLKDMD